MSILKRLFLLHRLSEVTPAVFLYEMRVTSLPPLSVPFFTSFHLDFGDGLNTGHSASVTGSRLCIYCPQQWKQTGMVHALVTVNILTGLSPDMLAPPC